MPQALAERIRREIEPVGALYHRLVLVVGRSGTGKTAALQQIGREIGVPFININLEVSRRMLELTERQRVLQVPRILAEIVGSPGAAVVLLDNCEVLFDVTLHQDPLRLLQGLSRNRTIVAAWNGSMDGGHLTYAVPDHPEHRRYSISGLVLVDAEAAD